MLLQTLTATLPEWLSVNPQMMAVWLAMVGFGAYHGLNPGMGWLFALSLGLQQRSERAIWVSLVPIALGHAAALGLVAVLVFAGAHFLSNTFVQWWTAALLLTFGVYKVVNYYRHPRWVGMKVNLRDLVWWSFLMAMAHGAGLMIAPALVGIATQHGHTSHAGHLAAGSGMFFAVSLHMLAMFVVMATVAWVVYKKVGLAVLRTRWVNFDLVWAVALLVVGCIAVFNVLWPAVSSHAGHM